MSGGRAAGGAAPRRLVLLRHAKSAWPDGVPDHERPLAGRGRRDAPVAGRWLRESGCLPDRVLCSTAERARQTWLLAAPEAGVSAAPLVGFDRRVYGASAAELLDLIRRVPAQVRTLLVVGHEPGMSGLALMLATTGPVPGGPDSANSAPAAELARLRVKFPTASIAVLEFAGGWRRLGAGRAWLTSFVTPRDLRAGDAGAQS